MYYFLVFLNILCLGFALYLFYLLKVKRTEGLKLEEYLTLLDQQTTAKVGEYNQVESQRQEAANALLHLLELEENETGLRQSVSTLSAQATVLANEIELLGTQKQAAENQLNGVLSDLSIYRPDIELINLGFIEEPEYLFETAVRFKEEIKAVRDDQKKMIRDGGCVEIPNSIAITPNDSHAKKVLKGQANLMVKAFNNECDILMGTVKTSNYAKILERIDKVATDLEKSSLSLKCGFSKEYLELKFKECELQYQFKLKQREEREEQALIREQMREEQKAIREYERALAKAQKEEQMYQDALGAARKELEVSGETEKLQKKIIWLETQLKEAQENEQRAKSMAEQTRRGHVYVISNIGSFGEDVYKIGLTRRLEPLDRVKELGGASVPFHFDVHAMIFSEDAPALETSLHRAFKSTRVNQVNMRKEFFNVNLLEIKNMAAEITGNELDFKVTAVAEDYYESLKLRVEGN